METGPGGDPATTFPEPRRFDRPPGWADDIETLSLLNNFPFLFFSSFHFQVPYSVQSFVENPLN
jgi:hypothetical protein